MKRQYQRAINIEGTNDLAIVCAIALAADFPKGSRPANGYFIEFNQRVNPDLIERVEANLTETPKPPILYDRLR